MIASVALDFSLLSASAHQNWQHLRMKNCFAAADEDRRAFDQARPVLLVAAGREPPNASGVHRYAAENCDVTATDGIVRLRTKSP
jgi:hypothetical protein